MTFRRLSARLLFVLPFIVGLLTIRSFQGEYINNAEVLWRYVRNDSGDILLAMDVYSPSGIELEGVSFRDADISAGWKRSNDPRWYQGEQGFPGLRAFQGVLQPYFPEPPPSDAMYTSGWYTFLYEWQMAAQDPPEEQDLKIRYRNSATGVIYEAQHEAFPCVIPELVSSPDSDPVIKLQEYAAVHPFAAARTRIQLENLTPLPTPGQYRLTDPNSSVYRIHMSLSGDKPVAGAILTGVVHKGPEGWVQVFFKAKEGRSQSPMNQPARRVAFQHAVAILLWAYMCFVFWRAGWWLAGTASILFEDTLEATVIPAAWGGMVLTYGFFALGIFPNLSWPVLAVIMSLLVVWSCPDGREWQSLGELVSRGAKGIRTHPWYLAVLGVLAYLLFHHLAYCFVPATFIDGSGDIENSYLPIFHHYHITGSFQAAIEVATYGIYSQAIDVMRTVAFILMGEPGIYLLGLFYWLLLAGAVCLIGRRIFAVRHMPVYVAVILLLCRDLFTEGFHFGKIHTAALSLLMLSLYVACRERKRDNGLLAPMFFGFLSAAYLHFSFLFFAWWALQGFGVWAGLRNRRSSTSLRRWWCWGGIFLIWSGIFYLKLFLEKGTCLPPGLIPEWLSNIFASVNAGNPDYILLDNDYIRWFYQTNGLANFGQKLALKELWHKLQLIPTYVPLAGLLLFIPIIKDFKPSKRLFVASTILLVALVVTLFPFARRATTYFVFPLFILQAAVIDSLVVRLSSLIPRHRSGLRRVCVFAVSLGLILWYSLKVEKGLVSFREPGFLEKGGILSLHPRQAKVYDVFLGNLSKYLYLQETFVGYYMFVGSRAGAERNLDHNRLIRQSSESEDMILIVPVRFHARTGRLVTSRHALGSVIYQKDIQDVMKDLKRLNIRYLSVMPVNYFDYNPAFSPIFVPENFRRYFKLIHSYIGCNFYEILYDGSGASPYPCPVQMQDAPFVPIKSTKGPE